MRGKKDKREFTKREEFLYHNTELLLKKYRDVFWSIEMSARQAKLNFELEMDCTIEDYLEMSYAAGVDMTGTNIAEQARILERNKKMLKIIEAASNIVRERYADGEELYWVLYYTYFSERPCRNTEEIINMVSAKIGFISWKKYFAKRKTAIEKLSNILWGFTSKDCLAITDEFLEKIEE